MSNTKGERIQRHRQRQGKRPRPFMPIPTQRQALDSVMRRFMSDPHAEQLNDVLISARDEFPNELDLITTWLAQYIVAWHRQNECNLGPVHHEVYDPAGRLVLS